MCYTSQINSSRIKSCWLQLYYDKSFHYQTMKSWNLGMYKSFSLLLREPLLSCIEEFPQHWVHQTGMWNNVSVTSEVMYKLDTRPKKIDLIFNISRSASFMRETGEKMMWQKDCFNSNFFGFSHLRRKLYLCIVCKGLKEDFWVHWNAYFLVGFKVEDWQSISFLDF